jgi:hypothetical protein
MKGSLHFYCRWLERGSHSLIDPHSPLTQVLKPSRLWLSTEVEVEVEVNLRPTVSRPVCPDIRRPSSTRDQCFFLLQISLRQLRVCYFVGPSLTRGRVCNLLYNCFWALKEQSLLGRSPAELTAIFYCLIWHSPNLEVDVEFPLRPTVSRPVRLGVLLLLEQVTRCCICLSDNYFLYFSCRALSLTRGRICNLQCNDASSIWSYIAIDGLSASSSWCCCPLDLTSARTA